MSTSRLFISEDYKLGIKYRDHDNYLGYREFGVSVSSMGQGSLDIIDTNNFLIDTIWFTLELTLHFRGTSLFKYTVENSIPRKDVLEKLKSNVSEQ